MKKSDLRFSQAGKYREGHPSVRVTVCSALGSFTQFVLHTVLVLKMARSLQEGSCVSATGSVCASVLSTSCARPR